MGWDDKTKRSLLVPDLERAKVVLCMCVFDPSSSQKSIAVTRQLHAGETKNVGMILDGASYVAQHIYLSNSINQGSFFYLCYLLLCGISNACRTQVNRGDQKPIAGFEFDNV